jgi:hypothetical protein
LRVRDERRAGLLTGLLPLACALIGCRSRRPCDDN